MRKSRMLLTCIFLTRACPRACSYCRIRDSATAREELSREEWQEAFLILKQRGVDFNLILGNEVLTLGQDFVDLVDFWHKEDIPYAVYTTFPIGLWERWRHELMRKRIRNLSAGIDVISPFLGHCMDPHIISKSERGIQGLLWAKEKGLIDHQANITMSKVNLDDLPDILDKITQFDLWSGLNVLHHNQHDPMFDFFPPPEEMEEWLLTKEDLPRMTKVVEKITKAISEKRLMLMNTPEFLQAWLEYGIDLNWHCTLPLILTIDSDGTMRTCGYRKGDRVEKYSIFDLQNDKKWDKFFKDWELDRKDCPGCFWSYWWLAEQQYMEESAEYAKEYFQKHRTRHFRRPI
ncbi:MAG: radical SAM protein [Planctomycetota bacterium]|jgi:MoaA/NifB/PqqE/SkfB family radical SAM enzyme